MTDAPSQRQKSRMKTLIRKLNNDISNMELTTGEWLLAQIHIEKI